ncbi:uncharacterized protein LY89DRAFT_467807 [Mollisia scopiformis]|uniref:Uncharacterized protein n=1 Tax=Mollisia scopiformis TaxID=149040 RepID=A0A194XIM3_MOLSC|nr:uncharacterized protein LY89DRAFT_467807 [Mollisia scopiformis]KUJ19981.1 hypothetical protein LY89DRAFT_467807 [Mollisia scopiformis]
MIAVNHPSDNCTLGLMVKSALPMRWLRVRFPEGAFNIFATILFVIPLVVEILAFFFSLCEAKIYPSHHDR